MADDLTTLLDPAQVTTDAEFMAAWERCLRQAPTEKPLTVQRRKARIPQVGTNIQRSSAANQQKIQALLETPPQPPLRRRGPPRRPQAERQKRKLEELFGSLSDLSGDEATPEDSDKQTLADTPPAVYGPAEPPPVKIRVDRNDLMPYFATIVQSN